MVHVNGDIVQWTKRHQLSRKHWRNLANHRYGWQRVQYSPEKIRGDKAMLFRN